MFDGRPINQPTNQPTYNTFNLVLESAFLLLLLLLCFTLNVRNHTFQAHIFHRQNSYSLCAICWWLLNFLFFFKYFFLRLFLYFISKLKLLLVFCSFLFFFHHFNQYIFIGNFITLQWKLHYALFHWCKWKK